MESVTTIDSVDPKQVKTKYGVKTVWNVSCADGRLYSTFKDEIGRVAGQSRGQTAKIGYSERPWSKQDSQTGEVKSGINYDLDYVVPVEGVTEAPTATVTPYAQYQPVVTFAQQGVSHTLTTKKPEPYVDEKSKQINRTAALKAAVELYVAGVYGGEDVIQAITKLTEELIPVVEGTTPAPLPVASPTRDTGGTGEIVDNQGNLVDF